MKSFFYFIAVLLLFVSLSLGGRLFDSFVKSPSYFAVTNSTCGQMNCTEQQQDCPVFAFSQADCRDNFCYYSPDFDTNVCTDPSQCDVSGCECEETTLSPGCKCTDGTYDCTCLDGVCQLSNGYLGEYCDESSYCQVGTCTKNKCEFAGAGANCTYDSDCEPQLFCNSSYCTMQPLCNETSGEPEYAYCENSGLCYNGVCYPVYTQPLGSVCVYSYNCLAGLGCSSNGDGELGTCQPVALGTECDADGDDCAAFTQQCVCTQPDDSFPTVCSDVGYGKCANEYAAMMVCILENDCFYYDSEDPTTACAQKCLPLYFDLFCCSTCLYPEFADNAQQNIIGSCAYNNVTTVDCCTVYPCAITPTSEICKGYTH